MGGSPLAYARPAKQVLQGLVPLDTALNSALLGHRHSVQVSGLGLWRTQIAGSSGDAETYFYTRVMLGENARNDSQPSCREYPPNQPRMPPFWWNHDPPSRLQRPRHDRMSRVRHRRARWHLAQRVRLLHEGRKRLPAEGIRASIRVGRENRAGKTHFRAHALGWNVSDYRGQQIVSPTSAMTIRICCSCQSDRSSGA